MYTTSRQYAISIFITIVAGLWTGAAVVAAFSSTTPFAYDVMNALIGSAVIYACHVARRNVKLYEDHHDH